MRYNNFGNGWRIYWFFIKVGFLFLRSNIYWISRKYYIKFFIIIMS
jgi:hypothetical protein